MKDQETVQGWSFVRIAAELGVAKSSYWDFRRKKSLGLAASV
jgi:hypothetical protein